MPIKTGGTQDCFLPDASLPGAGGNDGGEESALLIFLTPDLNEINDEQHKQRNY
jgi:hypothetical protein